MTLRVVYYSDVENAYDDPDGRTRRGHFSGLRVVYDESEGRVRELRVGGERVDSDEEYSVATNAYVVYHGSDAVTPDSVVDS